MHARVLVLIVASDPHSTQCDNSAIHNQNPRATRMSQLNLGGHEDAHQNVMQTVKRIKGLLTRVNTPVFTLSNFVLRWSDL